MPDSQEIRYHEDHPLISLPEGVSSTWYYEIESEYTKTPDEEITYESEDSLISDQLRSWLNVEIGPQVYEINKDLTRKYAILVGDPNPLWDRVAPPWLLPSLGLPLLVDGPGGLRSRVGPRLMFGANATQDVEYFIPVMEGDVITCVGKLASLEEKQRHKGGKNMVAIIEITYSNQRQEVVAILRNTFIFISELYEH